MVDETPTQDPKRYLAAKRTVEDRALNTRVWDAMAAFLNSLKLPIHVLELGAGIGSMAARLLAVGLIEKGTYTLVEQNAELLDTARKQLPEKKGLTLEFVEADLYEYLEQKISKVDLLIAHALLDLLDLSRALPEFLGNLKPGGAFYFPINYDGHTIFEPQIDPDFETALLARYNLSMDERVVDRHPSGSSRTGRLLVPALQAEGTKALVVGSSDWVVFGQDGAYPEDEQYFLYYILDTIGREMSGLLDIDQDRLSDWLSRRRQQIENGELLYVAHQVDVFGRIPA